MLRFSRLSHTRTKFKSLFYLLFITQSLALSTPLDDLRVQAENGESWAQFNLALQYFSGHSNPQGSREYSQAAKWFQKAALQGDLQAQTNFAYMLEEGLGVKQNSDQALSWYLQAAQSGDPEAQFQLGLRFLHGRSVPRDQQRGLQWINLAAEKNHVPAQALLGDWYSLGAFSDTESQNFAVNRGSSLENSVQWYKRAAKGGDLHSQYRLGFLLYHGRGLPANIEEAKLWLERAAKGGYNEAQYLLGCYYSGSTQRDLAQAYAWFDLANSGGSGRAGEALDTLKARLTSQELARAKQLIVKLKLN